MLGCVGEDLDIALNAPLNLFPECHVLVEHIFERGYNPIIDGSADGAVRNKALEGFTFIILLYDALLNLVEINAIHDLEIVFIS